MQKLKVDRQLAVFCALLLLIIAELGVFPWAVKKLVSLNKDISKFKGDLEYITREWPQRDLYESIKSGRQKEIERVQDKFLLPREESKVFPFISESGKRFNIEVEAISPGRPTDYGQEASEFSYFPIKIKAKGHFHDLVKFLACLQGSEYFFEARELSLVYAEPYNVAHIVICGLVQQ
jgi:hypothetical protein